MLNSRLVLRYGYDSIFVGALIAALTAVAAAITARTGGGWGLVVPLFLFASTTGFIVANSIAGALAHGHGDRDGPGLAVFFRCRFLQNSLRT